MSNLLDDIISVLDFEFTEQPSSRSSVMANDGEIVRINGELWKKSPVLCVHASSSISHKVLSAPKSALEALNKAHQDGIFPTGIRESYELLAAASELRLEELISECLDNLRSLNAFDESVDLPPELSVDAVMRVFNVLLNGPLRTVDIYKCQLSRIARYCANDRHVMTNAMNSLRQSLGRFKDIDLEGIPASFEAQTLPVAIYERKGELQTAVIIGAELRPVNLFGNRINLGDPREDGFYLKYGVYLLYLSCGKVHHKYLLDDSEPKEVLSSCHILITKRNFVLAVQNEKNFGSIFLWVDDVKFEKIYQSAGMIIEAGFSYNTRVLAVALHGGSFRIFKLENKNLLLLEEISLGDVIGIYPSGRNFLITRRMEDGIWIETHRVIAMSDGESSHSTDEQPAGKDIPMKIRSLESYCRIYQLGGSFFLRDSSGLKLVSNFPSLDETRTLTTGDELLSMSELWMSP